MFQDHEITILSINFLIISFAYLWMYPKISTTDGKKIINYDFIVSIVALLIAAILFWGSNLEFNMIFFSTNWFWFSIGTFLIIELPFFIWYFKKYDLFKSIF